jgi:sugar lactone lactonase YvrE
MQNPSRLWRAALVGSLAAGTVIALSGIGMAGESVRHGRPVHGAAARQQAMFKALAKSDSATSPLRGGEDDDLISQLDQYDFERTAPAGYVTGDALGSAIAQAARLSSTGGHWQEFTNQPYNAQPSDYTDPFWGNEGAGFANVGGRITALTTTPDGAWFAGAADGGVWRSRDQGQHWTPVFDNMPTLSIGALAVDPVDGSLWVGTGEANTSQDSYAGTGVYRSFDDGNSWRLVGGGFGFGFGAHSRHRGADGADNPLANHTVFRIAFAPNGTAYAATNNGLFRMSAHSDHWTEVLDPFGPTDNPPYDQQVTDVAVQPGSGGQVVIAAIGWHGPGNTENNGFYQSTDFGHTFALVTPTGQINASDIGRTTFAYSADGSKLYAIVQSPAAQGAGAASVLQGIYSASGSPASVTGPWTLLANSAKLAASGSASPTFGSPGVQTWYNQDLAVDPGNPNHIYAGLEEVYESTDGGNTWITASPYWNYNFACDYTNPPSCPNVTHPDQHAMMISDNKIVIGNDGGVYSRPLSDTAEDGNWTDLNATLHDLQFYDARAGNLSDGSTVVWGGMQDNGSGILSNTTSQMSEAAGGDGFDVIVDPNNANNIVGEYTYGATYTSTDGGHSFSDFITPTCLGQEIVGLAGGPRSDCDPNPRFVTPLVPDQTDINTWVTGGEFVWVSHDGWNTQCTNTACSWTPVYDTGAGHAISALASTGSGGTIYAAWVAGGGNPGPSFASGIATNYGGTWHQINMAGLPNRYISGVTVDPSNPAHAYAVFGAYSRRWIPGAGVGHVFETYDGGQTWTDISGNLPDVPGDALVLSGGKLALGTDIGVFTAQEGQGAGTTWSRLGHGLPNVVIDDLTAGPNGFIYAGTHGRGVWRIRFPRH